MIVHVIADFILKINNNKQIIKEFYYGFVC